MARLQVEQKSWLASKSSKSLCSSGGIIRIGSPQLCRASRTKHFAEFLAQQQPPKRRVKWLGRTPSDGFSSAGMLGPWPSFQFCNQLICRIRYEIRLHDLRHTCITKLAESQASEQTIMAIAVSRRMLKHYSRIPHGRKAGGFRRYRIGSEIACFDSGVHHVPKAQEAGLANSLN
jgi:hypothetical protein